MLFNRDDPVVTSVTTESSPTVWIQTTVKLTSMLPRVAFE